MEHEHHVLLELHNLESVGTDEQAVSQARADAEEARENVKTASRKAAKALVKVRDAVSELEKLGVKPDNNGGAEDETDNNPPKPSDSEGKP